ASVHIAEIFTSGVSGLDHHRLGNVNKKLFRNLVVPGVIGGILGAWLSSLIDGKLLTPYIAGYLLLMGVVILLKAFKPKNNKPKKRKLFPLALFGGFADAIGGGGWGPIVNSTLLSSGHTPRYAIGSVNLAEFFVAFFTALSFIIFLGLSEWNNLKELSSIIAGLIFGGVFAAPFAAIICKKLKAKTLMIVVGLLIIILSAKTLFT
ncbi:MAG: sulfite exporter TauE/SafE family protein, partial [Candidatus Paceibacterota bacterium]